MSFEILNAINVNDKVEKRLGLSYLSWSNAWCEFKKVYPDAKYKILKNADNLPYFEDHSGAMVYTEVEAGGLTYDMWLPVMDSSNKAMKKDPYEYITKQGKRHVEAYTMFDINKTLMRCLTKNLAMFGLGLYIYSGEDLPEGEVTQVVRTVAAPVAAPIPVVQNEGLPHAIKSFVAQCKHTEELYNFYNKAIVGKSEKGVELLTELYKKRKEELFAEEALRDAQIAQSKTNVEAICDVFKDAEIISGEDVPF